MKKTFQLFSCAAVCALILLIVGCDTCDKFDDSYSTTVNPDQSVLEYTTDTEE